jgi:hypothetical protein
MTHTCRGCKAPLSHVFADLGRSPLSNAFKTEDELAHGETTFPLKVYVCDKCWLVQLPEFVSPDTIFTDYAYFSSVSPTWVEHAKTYADEMMERFKLGSDSLVVEVASNDGYLLQHFVGRTKVQGIEPAANVAVKALAKGVPTLVKFFGADTAHRIVKYGAGRADLIHACNVLAHVPDIHDFVEGFKVLLATRGTITFEFPHLTNLIKYSQIDTIYHEHFSYLSLAALLPIFEAHGLMMYDVEHLPTHGGSLRLFVGHAEYHHAPTMRLVATLAVEEAAGIKKLETYTGFAKEAVQIKLALLEFLIENDGLVVGFGAPAKATTLLNYCGVGPELLPFTVEDSPAKINKFIPGVQIPILPVHALIDVNPGAILIFPWNLRAPIAKKLRDMKYMGKFVTAIPTLYVFD